MARANLSRRAVRIHVRDAGNLIGERIVDIVGLAFDGQRWLVAATSGAPPSVRLIDLSRVTRVRPTRRSARPAPREFDVQDFSFRHLLDSSTRDVRQATLWLADPLAAVAPALVPGGRLVPAQGGGWECHVRTSRPALVASLAKSLAPWAAVDCHSPMPATPSRKKDRDDTAESRLLRLASWLLAQGDPVTRERIYDAFPDDYRGKPDAKERKFTRDKDALKRLGFPIDKVDLGKRDEQVGYVLDARSCSLPPIELTPDEAALVWTAGIAALRFSDHPLRDDLESALRKLLVGAKGLPPRAARTEELVTETPAGQEKMLERLIEAWERRKRITIDYWRVATGEVVRRDVHVYGWAFRRGEWIFVGHDHLRNAVRIFYLSRVRSLKVNSQRAQDPDYEVPSDFDVRRWSRQQVWDYDVHPPMTATVRFRGSLARIARQLLPGASIATDVEGARVARLEVRNVRGLVRQALAWGPEAEIVEPEEARAIARDILSPLAAPAAGIAP